MMIDAPQAERPQVAVVAESRELEADATKALNALRRSGISAELFATGSPRKRYDRALKSQPAMTISYDVRDGIPARNNRILRGDDVDHSRVQAVLDALELR
jgi:histidyl-tRNA synthetase